MKKYIILSSFWLLCLFYIHPLSGQIDCKPDRDTAVITQGEVLFYYGSTTNAFNFTRRSDISLGQPLVGQSLSQRNIIDFGFWSRFLLPPSSPTVSATQGEILDRIRVSWSIDPLSPAPDGYNIFRDGVFLDKVDQEIRNYNDFNVIAGVPYTYEVSAVNKYGESPLGSALGFQVPNGTITGVVQTPSGNPVPDALITLTPMQGFAIQFGSNDGAYLDTVNTNLESLLPAQGDWSLTFWLKTDQAVASSTILDLAPHALEIRPLGNSSEGVAIFLNDSKLLEANFPESSNNDWNHLGLTYDGKQYRLYINGELAALNPGAPVSSVTQIEIGAAGTAGWAGNLDELRIYHSLLDELDFDNVKNGTASTLTPGLVAYWKFDEGQGQKSFDLFNRSEVIFCGAQFDNDRPPVRIAGVTNEDGYYRIEAASYGTGTTFLAFPSKNFYSQRALEFVRDEEDYATLPDFSITEKATLELWLNSAGPDGEQCILSKQWSEGTFQLRLQPNGTDNDIILSLDGAQTILGSLGMKYQHLAFTIDNENQLIQAYKNGEPLGSAVSIPGSFNDWTDDFQDWIVGACVNGVDTTDHFGGLIAEVAVYDTTLDQSTIQDHVNTTRNPQEPGLRIFFSMNEGNGSQLNNMGSVLTGRGSINGASWSNFAPNQSTTPHVLTPRSRQVTLNPSVTSVDQVDFTDRSTVPVIGYVRYSGTDCFAPDVEILVNGASNNPAIFTDSTGRFVIDVDPGTTALLSPKFEDHRFEPRSWQVNNVVNPIAGILFNDVTKRTISGQVAGGECKKSIIQAPPGEGQGTVAIVKIRSVDGCYERQLTIDNQEGNYVFENVPPLSAITVAVVEHSDPKIKAAFQTEGGITVDLSDRRDTIVDFIYFAEPQVRISGFETFSDDCDIIVLEQNSRQKVNIELFEQYVPTESGDDGVCLLDTGNIRIINGLADMVLDTILSGKKLEYEFRAGTPNPSPPFFKTFQAIGETIEGREGSSTVQAIVTGRLNKTPTFTTQLPEVPWLVLRDPPGDASYSFWEKDNKVCRTMKSLFESEQVVGGGKTILTGVKTKITLPFGGPIIETDIKAAVNIKGKVSFKQVKSGALEVCMSTSERISTSSEEYFIGENGDVFVGMGINLKVGLTDVVEFDPDSCKVDLSEEVSVEPLTPTTFMYSQYHIENNVIRFLDKILSDEIPESEADSTNYAQSITTWQRILADNADQKERASAPLTNVASQNISFDAGASYEYKVSSDTTSVSSLEVTNKNEFETETEFGGEINGVGLTGKIILGGSLTFGIENKQESSQVGVTTGFSLADNDIGDAFTVDVVMDSVYQTPVFRLIAGQSSCPWEPETANREYPNIQVAEGSSFQAVNVPAHEAAVFRFNLGNLSATAEDFTYGLTAVPAKNPHGARIKVNGTALNGNVIRYTIPFGESIPVTITVERGPIEYDYEGLRLMLFSECEADYNFTLGTPIDKLDTSLLFSHVDLNVNFIRPCSEVDINVPEQNWVVRNNDRAQPGTTRRITASGYDLSVPDFKLVRVQYRRSDGDGAWINLPVPEGEHFEAYNPNWSGFKGRSRDQIGSDTILLNADFTQFIWETVGLADGNYEIHAWAVCSGDAADKPGFSEIIKGRIDREPPKIVGLTEPADGVYHVGDEISATFNKWINCDSALIGFNAQKNKLVKTVTGELIDATASCYENKLIIHPSFLNPNSFLENQLLRVELGSLQDLTGNKIAEPLVWEFFVDRNELAWLTDSVGMTKYEDETSRVSAKVHNRSGSAMPFSIEGTPDWVRVYPDTGYLVPNEVLEIIFEVEENTLAFGNWSDTVFMKTHPGQNPNYWGGEEPLRLGARVICRPPAWTFEPGQFLNTMNLSLDLVIEGVPSKDEEDILVALIDGEVRGKSYLEYVPVRDSYFAFLTIYGEESDLDKPIEWRVWDASTCLVYEGEFLNPGETAGQTLSFSIDHYKEGTIRTQGDINEEIPLNVGWNWLSFNLDFPVNDLNTVFSGNTLLDGNLLRSQISLAEYFEGTWFGTLNSIDVRQMYLLNAGRIDTLSLWGKVLNPGTPIPLQKNWNWISYLPKFNLPVKSAMQSYQPQDQDIIKSQTSFAVYVEDIDAWLGNLRFMEPHKGYQLYTSQDNPSQLIYPDHPLGIPKSNDQDTTGASPFWALNPLEYEFSMTLIGMVSAEGLNVTDENMELGAFHGEEVRGSTKAVFVEPLNAYLFFMTCYANENGEMISFKLFDSEMNEVKELTEAIPFVVNLHSGGIKDPVPFTFLTTNTKEEAFQSDFTVIPNPFRSETVFQFSLPNAQDITLRIVDIGGKEVRQIRTQGNAGLNAISWNGQTTEGTRLQAGVYFVRLQTEQGNMIRKVILMD